ncbi:UNVERIFIED_CONTAM: hypothetical protein FKN15_035356 [Acipenser sinensis]
MRLNRPQRCARRRETLCGSRRGPSAAHREEKRCVEAGEAPALCTEKRNAVWKPERPQRCAQRRETLCGSRRGPSAVHREEKRCVEAGEAPALRTEKRNAVWKPERPQRCAQRRGTLCGSRRGPSAAHREEKRCGCDTGMLLQHFHVIVLLLAKIRSMKSPLQVSELSLSC